MKNLTINGQLYATDKQVITALDLLGIAGYESFYYDPYRLKEVYWYEEIKGKKIILFSGEKLSIKKAINLHFFIENRSPITEDQEKEFKPKLIDYLTKWATENLSSTVSYEKEEIPDFFQVENSTLTIFFYPEQIDSNQINITWREEVFEMFQHLNNTLVLVDVPEYQEQLFRNIITRLLDR